VLIIKVWCLPKTEEQALRELHKAIFDKAKLIDHFGIASEDDVVNLFPVDMMAYGLGSEIVVEIAEVPPTAPRFTTSHNSLVRNLAEVIQEKFPDANIHASINHPAVPSILLPRLT
jgi:hypothetical protein